MSFFGVWHGPSELQPDQAATRIRDLSAVDNRSRRSQACATREARCTEQWRTRSPVWDR